MKTLVTGSAGFIGSHLVDALIARGDEVYGIDDMSGGFVRNINPLSIPTKFDLRNRRQTEIVINRIKPQVIYHLAANAAENKAQFSPQDIATRNINTFLNLIVPAIRNGLKRFVFTSSIAVYGAIQTPFNVSDNPKPEDIYGITKLCVEEMLKVLSKVHGFEYVIVRPHNVYGPRQNMSDPYRNVITIWMNAILREKPCYIYGDGTQKRQFTYISDLIEAILSIKRQGTYNVGSDTIYTINGLFTAIQAVIGKRVPLKKLPLRPQEVITAVAKNYKTTMTPLQVGLQKTWEWAQKMGPQELRYTELEIPNSKVPKNWL